LSLVLSPQDLIDLTGRAKPAYQRKQLEHLKIPFKPRTDGTLVVHRAHVDLLLGAPADSDSKPEPRLRFG
jgi:hypothetical protein